MKTDELNAITETEANVYAADLTDTLPDLSLAEEVKIDLMSDYWTPTTPNESKRVFFSHISNRNVVDQTTGDIFELECAYFVEQTKDGLRTISNGSKRLVGAMYNNHIRKGTPLLITYLGKKKNSTNSFMSDMWSVKLLKI